MKKNTLKISVIVPVYNAELYLERCIDSILQQSYNNLEIIIVNDGSTDSSKSVIDCYALKDNRIIVTHKVNGGIGSAYNIAFEKMTGDYVSFIDSDDYVTQNYYQDIIGLIEMHNPDIVHFGRVLFNDKNQITDNLKRYNEVIDGNEAILDHHFKLLKDPSLACRVFKKGLFNNVTLFDQNIGIDEILIAQVLVKTNKVVFTDKVYYYTYERSDSVSRIEYSEQKILQGIKIYQFICEFIRVKKPKYANFTDIKYLNYLMPIYEIVHLSKNHKLNEVLKSLETDINQYYDLTKNTSNFNHLPFLLRLKIKAIVNSKIQFEAILKFIKLKKRVF